MCTRNKTISPYSHSTYINSQQAQQHSVVFPSSSSEESDYYVHYLPTNQDGEEEYLRENEFQFKTYQFEEAQKKLCEDGVFGYLEAQLLQLAKDGMISESPKVDWNACCSSNTLLNQLIDLDKANEIELGLEINLPPTDKLVVCICVLQMVLVKYCD